ncbi:probable RNA-binding protein 19 isoform X1 [Chiloscyllium plagiosum]|uniref:probable RNA-binding protein 19 isoform X1 n=2 Tax=Chiloscyllium plagiosum TaxID=36176 RepID=UPI001CB852A2|nr:probable RNA-binding protein 19 isoform X1 [Chiloscyllium plagiosum]XP_043571784.1 probable RNA-binding protein 19 isoform X1 [Chiloscyllium plagiosum]
MSRLIVKNLPSGMKDERFKTLFGAFGTLTDCTLKFTKDGKFRKFGFVGFKTEEEAQAALKHFNKSYIDTSRIAVEFCKSFGDPGLSRPWSKHSQRNQAGQIPKKTKEQSCKSEGPKDKQKKSVIENLEHLKEDDEFEEFLAVHQNRSNVPTWTNDTLPAKKKDAAQLADYLNFDSEDSEELSQEQEDTIKEPKSKQKQTEENVALRNEVSDMDYLRSKIVKAEGESESDDESEADAENNLKLSTEGSSLLHTDSNCESGEKKQDNKQREETQLEKKKQQNEPTTPFTLKLRGAPFSVKEKQIREFFVPIKPVAIRIVKNANGNTTGFVFVDFESEGDLEKALQRNKDYMGGRYIELFRQNNAQTTKPDRKNVDPKWLKREKKEDEEEEDISDSGRLFVRNLSYTSTEEDLEKVFSKYGPLAEIHFPIDSLTKKPKGFAFITYMMPEHAVKAFAELDGEVFQGRMMHILPSTVKKEKAEDSETSGLSTYKRNKAAKDKASSSSSHNWNTLFMGTNAVADTIAAKYNATKSQVLDHEGKGSVAVRMALGETEIVQETRQFLIDNGVRLDSFSQGVGKRSKTVILVKNIPVGTQAEELEKVFKKYGDLARVLLPPAGVTAIVEFLEPTEAKQAFTKLAYSKFQHVPLYLEWAPMDVFCSSTPEIKKPEEKQSNTDEGDQAKDENEADNLSVSEEEHLPGCTLFVKNLNFLTTEETLVKTFEKCGSLKNCSISKKKDKTGSLLSMGYGFVEYAKSESANKALKLLQHCMVDGHQLELKISDRATISVNPTRKFQKTRKQTVSKILIRNIPFQTKVKEIRELFSTFGEIKTVRLPKKMGGTGAHRGFGFVDFVTKQDAKKAFNALCHSTHLYGRRLVLEWADSEDTVETLRRKTAEHYHDSPKKKRQSEILDEIMEEKD